MNFVDNSFYKTSLKKNNKQFIKVQLLKKYIFGCFSFKTINIIGHINLIKGQNDE